MYTKRIQLINYGPITKLDIQFPFRNGTPQPVVLVGHNGSGKSILLSHIVNGLLTAKDIAFPEAPEVEPGKVYKFRSTAYIKGGQDFYFGRVDFADEFFVSEIRTRLQKQEYSDIPSGITEPNAQAIWKQMDLDNNDHYESNFDPGTANKIKESFNTNAVLYFPFNRFEEPAWLNEENLKAQAQHIDRKQIVGHTNRKIITSSPLRENQNWLFDLIYDRAAFELQARPLNVPTSEGSTTIVLPSFSGDATLIYETVLDIVRGIMRNPSIRFGIGRRNNRGVSIISEDGPSSNRLVPNIFQLSSGETSLLNLFLSILRDFDLSHARFSNPSDVHGTVLIDEIDLHLHAVHQYEVLPNLIRLFPNVQFVVTTHSPLFVLGMEKALGENGYALYRLPNGHRISSEEFSEFGDAYQAFAETVKFSNDTRAAIQGAHQPIVYAEGTTGQRYIRRASKLLRREAILTGIEVKDGGGAGDLKNIWKSWLPDLVPHKVVLLFDCEEQLESREKQNLFRRTIPMQPKNPVQKGIENLFNRETLKRAQQHKPAFIDVDPGRTRRVRGQPQIVPETWTINEDEKTNLCAWLCENGTKDDFQGFQVIFDLLEDLLDPSGEAAGTPNDNGDSALDEPM